MDLSYDDYLAHYGVKGMKWGVRKDEAVGRIKAKRQKAKESRIAADEGKYLNKGLTSEEAHAKAVKREKVRHRVKVVGGVAVTAAVAYIGTQEYKKRFQSVDLPMDTKLKNINRLGDDLDIDRRLYVTYKPGDSKKYRGAYAEQLRSGGPLGGLGIYPQHIFETTLTTTERIKAPSHHQAKKLYKEYREKRLSGLSKAELNMIGGDAFYLPKDYKIFNASLVNTGNKFVEENPGMGGMLNNKEIHDGFYKFLKSKGYNSVLDTNDQFISGYNTEKPLIVFNANSSAVKSGQKVVSQKESVPLARITTAQAVARQVGKAGAKIGVAYGANRKLKQSIRNRKVKQYFKDHPNSEMTEAEVHAMLDRKSD